MKVSVIIPVYNEENYIDLCLKSLVNQEERPDEIIIVNNNSTDNTVKIAKKYPVLIVKESKQGMIQARNCGFDKGVNEILARCDADVILPPFWIKKIRRHFLKSKIDALTGPVVFYDLPLKTPLYCNAYLKSLNLIQKGNNTLLGPNMIITKKIWKKVRSKVCLDNKKVHEDIDLAIHIIREGGKIIEDRSLIVKASGRRIKNDPISFFTEYPIRIARTLLYHLP